MPVPAALAAKSAHKRRARRERRQTDPPPRAWGLRSASGKKRRGGGRGRRNPERRPWRWERAGRPWPAGSADRISGKGLMFHNIIQSEYRHHPPIVLHRSGGVLRPRPTAQPTPQRRSPLTDHP